MNSQRQNCAALTLLETLGVVAIIGILAAFAVPQASEVTEGARLSKLNSDTAAINQAIRIYLANGGSLDGITGPQAVLDKLKTERSATADAQFAGFSGSMIDQRLTVQMQSSTEAATAQPRAMWNATEQRFEVKTAGSGGVARFLLDDSVGRVDYGTEERRDSPIAMNSEDGWIWPFSETTPMAAPAPTAIPVVAVGGSSGSGSSGSGSSGSSGSDGSGSGDDGAPLPDPEPSDLLPPTFSPPGGAYSPSSFDLAVEILNPNPPDGSWIVYSIDGGSPAVYSSALSISPGSTVTALVTGTPSLWNPSSVVSASYTALPPVQIAAPTISPSATEFPSSAPGMVTVTLVNNHDPATSTLQYRVDGGAWTAYSTPFDLAGSAYPAGATIEAQALSTSPDYTDSPLSSATIDPSPMPSVFSGFCGSALAQYGVTVLDGGQFKLSHEEAGIFGNVAIAPGATWNISAGGVTGDFVIHPGNSGSGGDTMPGPGGDPLSPVTEDLSDLRTLARDLSTQAAALTPTQSFGKINGPTTISATAPDGLNVISINEVSLSGADALTISGGESDYFVLNLISKVSMSGGSTWILDGGVQPSNVIINMLPSASTFQGSGGSGVLTGGVILAPHSGNRVAITGSSVITGHVIVNDEFSASGGAQVVAGACGGAGGSGSGGTTKLSAPSIAVSAPNFISGSVETITVTLTDPNDSAVSDLQYRIDGGAWTTYSTPFTVTMAAYPSGATVEAQAIATDAAYSDSATASKTIRLAATSLVDADFDTSIAGSVPNWSGDSGQLYANGMDPAQTLVYFNLADDITGPAMISSAVLYLTSTIAGTDGIYTAHEIATGVSWTSGGLTWNTAVNGLDGAELGTALDTSTVTSTIPGVSGWSDRKMWDITSAVQNWIDDPGQNNGIAIIAAPGEREIFCSMEHPGASVRPKLVIEWTTP